MAEDSPKRVKEFWAETPRQNEDFLGVIRDWQNISIALDDEVIWLKGFLPEQIDSPEIQQLPSFLVYELRDGLLFKKNALVPEKKTRTALLWSPIDKALRLTFPPSNHNFFGINEGVDVKLKSSEEEQPAIALLSPIVDIKEAILGLPKFKLEKLDWVVIHDKALFLGTPLLSLPGKTFWKKDGHLLPTGYDFEFKNLSKILQNKLNSQQENWIFWKKNGSFAVLKKEDFRKLSLSSFRLTEKAKEWN